MTQPTNPKPLKSAPILVSALFLGGLLAAACDLTPVPPQQAAGQTNGGTSSGGTGVVADGGGNALGGSGGSATTGGAGGSAGGGIGGSGGTGAGGTGGAAAAGTGGAPAGGTGGPTGGSGGGPAQGNLVSNGDFSQGDTLWHVDTYAGSETHSVVNGAFCVVLNQNASVTVGWPMDVTRAFAVSDGASYQFSYQASVSGSPTSLTFTAIVGPASTGAGSLTPFSATDTVGASLQTFQHPFTAAGSSPSAGVAFNIQASAAAAVTVCIDNVSVAGTAK